MQIHSARNLGHDVRKNLLRYFAQQTSSPSRKVQTKKGSVESSKENLQKDQNNSSTVAAAASSYCVDIVRKHDHDNYLSTLLLPDARLRTAVFALRAFNCEIALIRDQVTQVQIGLGRYVFWKDALRQLFKSRIDNASDSGANNGNHSSDTLPKHPVIQELNRTILKAENVSQKWFQNIIESREQIMNDNAFPTLTELEKYADLTVTPIFYLAFEFMNIRSLNLDHCASHLGKAIGLANFIRGIPYNAQKRRVLVPQELMLKHKISQEKFVRLDEREKIHDVVFDLATCAHLHYEKAKSLQSVIEKELKSCLKNPGTNPFPLFLSAVPSKIYLKRLQKFNFNPFEAALGRRNNLLPWHLYFEKFMKTYY